MKYLNISEGNLVKMGELRKVGENNSVINFTLAYTPKRLVNDEWIDGDTVWTDHVAWGKKAESIANNNIPKGTPLLVIGYRGTTTRKAWTNADGEEIPERKVDEVTVEEWGVKGVHWRTIAEQMGKEPAKSAPKATPAKKEKVVQSDDDLFAFDDTDTASTDLDGELDFL